METTRDAYSARASEYAAALGTVDAMSPLDRARIAAWGTSVEGAILDAGCGPGHWTAFMRALGADASGLDLVPAFIQHARATFDGIDYSVGSVLDLDYPDGSFGGILAWYSLIHLPSEDVQCALREFARVLRPGGTLLVGFFEGREHAEFDHAVAPAYFWRISDFRSILDTAGFDVDSIESRTDPGTRPHASITARRR